LLHAIRDKAGSDSGVEVEVKVGVINATYSGVNDVVCWQAASKKANVNRNIKISFLIMEIPDKLLQQLRLNVARLKHRREKIK
jgi:hypothetical protein